MFGWGFPDTFCFVNLRGVRVLVGVCCFGYLLLRLLAFYACVGLCCFSWLGWFGWLWGWLFCVFNLSLYSGVF